MSPTYFSPAVTIFSLLYKLPLKKPLLFSKHPLKTCNVDFYNVKRFVSYKPCSFELIRHRINKKIIQLFSTFEHQIIISDGSCDTEDWSNDDNLALITGINDILA